MQVVMAIGIEDSEEDKASGANDRKYDSCDREAFVDPAAIMCQTPLVSEPSFGNECEVKDDNCDRATSDEQRLVVVCSSVGEIGDVLVRIFRRIATFPIRDPDQ